MGGRFQWVSKDEISGESLTTVFTGCEGVKAAANKSPAPPRRYDALRLRLSPNPGERYGRSFQFVHHDDSRLPGRHQPSLTRAAVVKSMWVHMRGPKLSVVPACLEKAP
jgi:hypothetical protein